MAKLRSVSTGFWSDPFIEDLTPVQKLLFLYLITNEKTNMLGIYEASIKKISFETGINTSDINKALELFKKSDKVKYLNNYVVLLNYMKHQNYNTNMKKSAIDTYNNLPNELKDNDVVISKDNASEGFERLSKALGMVSKIEVEDESKVEYEKETKTKLEFVYNKVDFSKPINLWLDYKKEKKQTYKSDKSIQIFFDNLIKLSCGNFETAEKIINQSIGNNWAGIFELKNEAKKESKPYAINEDMKNDPTRNDW